MPVRVTVSGKRLDQLELVNAKVMEDIGDMAVAEILERTGKGQDVDGGSFQGYTPEYAKRKVKLGGYASPVNLRSAAKGRSVHMLEALQRLSATARTVTIGFQGGGEPGAQELALYHDELGAGKSRVIRHFFGLSRAFLDTAVERVKRAWTFGRA
jgi:hypothetical protein